VVITTYNRPSYLRQAVETVLDQTYERVELVVVDDHSETPAREALREVPVDSFVEFNCIRHARNRGVNAARNTGIEAATGEYIAFLDDDDQWEPEKLERQVETFQRSADDVGVVYTGSRIIKDDTEELFMPDVEGDMTKTLLCRNVVGTMSVVMVRADLAAENPLDERFPAWADLEWYINLSTECAFKRVSEPLVFYKQTSHERITKDFQTSKESYQLFLEEFEPLAAQYGTRFLRKMRGWTAFRVGTSAFYSGNYDYAQRYFTTAVTSYPFEPQFYKYLAASLGGESTHRVAQMLKRYTS
jgi:glycosyltransferase involved in cell wall biosynthesis